MLTQYRCFALTGFPQYLARRVDRLGGAAVNNSSLLPALCMTFFFQGRKNAVVTFEKHRRISGRIVFFRREEGMFSPQIDETHGWMCIVSNERRKELIIKIPCDAPLNSFFLITLCFWTLCTASSACLREIQEMGKGCQWHSNTFNTAARSMKDMNDLHYYEHIRQVGRS